MGETRDEQHGENEVPELTDAQQQQMKRAKRGCLLAFTPLWVVLMLGAVIGGIFLISEIDREPEVINARVSELMEISVPEGFYPFSRNAFLGTEAISYYHADHLREDGRTTSVISVQVERDWQEMTAAQLEAETLDQLETRLVSRELTVTDKVPVPFEQDGRTQYIYRFSGRQLLGEEVLPAHACFRYFDGPEGAFRVQTMGLDESFPAEAQIEVLKSIRPRPRPK